MIEVRYVGQLGNNLFQYALGRILAEGLGFELRCVPAGPESPSSLDKLAASFADCPQTIPGRRFVGPEVEDVLLMGHRVDLPGLLAHREGRHIVLQGWFQRTEYFAPHRDRIRRWFALGSAEDPYGIAAGDLLVGLRRGPDYLLQGVSLDLSYYEDLLTRLSFDRLFVVGDVIDREVLRRFKRYRPIYVGGSPIEDLRLFQHFRRVVIPNGTFAWWGAYLSDAEEVYFPLPRRGYWKPDNSGLDLTVGESRYRHVDDVPSALIPPLRSFAAKARRALRRRVAVVKKCRGEPRIAVKALRPVVPSTALPESTVALPKVFVQAPRRDPLRERGAGLRCLIVQSDGAHDRADRLPPDWYLRECYALQHAFQQQGVSTDIWGLGHAGFERPPDLESYDVLLCLEDSRSSWLPDLGRVRKPVKLHRVTDVHRHGSEPCLLISEGCDVVLHETMALMADYAGWVRNRRHLWFPRGCDDRYFVADRWRLPKAKDLTFVGADLGRRAGAVHRLARKVSLEWFRCTGTDRIATIAVSRIHFDQADGPGVSSAAFETVGLGTCLLTNRIPELLELGFVDGANCLLYDSVEEAVDKATLALRDGSWARIGERGYELSKGHSYSQRVRNLLQTVRPPAPR